MNILRLYDRIVVKRIDEQEATQHGVVIPDVAKEKLQEGEVLAVGRTRWSSTSKSEIVSCLESITVAKPSCLGPNT